IEAPNAVAGDYRAVSGNHAPITLQRDVDAPSACRSYFVGRCRGAATQQGECKQQRSRSHGSLSPPSLTTVLSGEPYHLAPTVAVAADLMGLTGQSKISSIIICTIIGFFRYKTSAFARSAQRALLLLTLPRFPGRKALGWREARPTG